MEMAAIHWCFMRVNQSSVATGLKHYIRVNKLLINTRMKVEDKRYKYINNNWLHSFTSNSEYLWTQLCKILDLLFKDAMSLLYSM